jgi:hypothetical protein
MSLRDLISDYRTSLTDPASVSDFFLNFSIPPEAALRAYDCSLGFLTCLFDTDMSSCIIFSLARALLLFKNFDLISINVPPTPRLSQLLFSSSYGHFMHDNYSTFESITLLLLLLRSFPAQPAVRDPIRWLRPPVTPPTRPKSSGDDTTSSQPAGLGKIGGILSADSR